MKHKTQHLIQAWANSSLFWCDFDRTSSLICGNKVPARCNRGFYCRSYCLLNMFGAPLCPSSGAEVYYTLVAACGISCCDFQVVENHSSKYQRQQPSYNTLELLMMGIVVPETWWASNKICSKNLCYIYLAFYFHISSLFIWGFDDCDLWDNMAMFKVVGFIVTQCLLL